ncbi:cytidylyltransferase domain-containing protein [Anaerovibrio slackiae]|uniref:RraA family protein n=1 Tax=Anaerovibrio slackiae TaxID=2652309 RepID=UPI0038706E37
MKVVAFLPAKGNSERVENKNVKLLDGKPLFLHNLEKLAECEFIDEVYLDSESDRIFELASEVNCKFMHRDPSLATNKTDGHQLFFNEAKQVDADIYVQLLGTSPFIKKATIQKGIDILVKNTEYDSVVLVRKEKQYHWKDDQPMYDKFHIPNSFNLDDTVIETMGLYIVRNTVALEKQMRFGDKVFLLEADALEAIDVNYPDDFELASYIAAGMREKDRQLLRNMGQILTSCILSDILDDMEIKGVIRGMQLNMADKKVMGRAKTLKLRLLKDGEDFTGIYDALESYNTIVPSDVIVVQNECDEYAYFGDLNANMALRAGAVGAVIGGKTRDYSAVKALNFPVFSTGYSCADVRKRATTESYNKRIIVQGIEVSPGDLIFGDNDGVVVIPQKYEDEVLKRAFESIEKEAKVRASITTGMQAKNIVGKVGAF